MSASPTHPEELRANLDVYIVGVDGRNDHRLTRSREDDTDPAWAPDGRRIAFASRRGCSASHYPEIYLMGANGSRSHRLGRSLPGWHPAWSADGRRIMFQSGRGSWLWIVDSDGSNPKQLSVPGEERFAWSPDGRRIAFSAFTRRGGYDLYVSNTDGSDRRRVTRTAADEGFPAWSPDGRRIAFVRGANSIYIINADGSSQRRLTIGSDPTWSPDGRRIAFVGGLLNIYVIDADGTDRRQLTDHRRR